MLHPGTDSEQSALFKLRLAAQTQGRLFVEVMMESRKPWVTLQTVTGPCLLSCRELPFKFVASLGSHAALSFTACANAIQEGNALHVQASRGDTAALASTLQSGQDVNARDAQGCTALHWAADRGELEVPLTTYIHAAAAAEDCCAAAVPTH